jgi:hypothetical protein
MSYKHLAGPRPQITLATSLQFVEMGEGEHFGVQINNTHMENNRKV